MISSIFHLSIPVQTMLVKLSEFILEPPPEHDYQIR